MAVVAPVRTEPSVTRGLLNFNLKNVFNRNMTPREQGILGIFPANGNS